MAAYQQKIAQVAVASANTIQTLYTAAQGEQVTARLTVVNPGDTGTVAISVNISMDTGTTTAAAAMDINRIIPKQSQGSITLPYPICLKEGQRVEVKASVAGTVFALVGTTTK